MSESYWLDDASLDVETEEGNPVAIAGLQGVQITPQVSIERLYTADSIKIEAQKQQEFQVDVSIDYQLYDETAVQEWLGGPGASGTSMADDSDPQMFEVSGTFESVGGDVELDVTVSNVTFEEFPVVQASRGEFVENTLNGTGEDITVEEVST